METESSRQTITRVLSAYELGAKLRRLRLRKKLGLKELGRHTGLAAGDAACFDSSEPHSYRGAGQEGARALVFTMALRP